MAKAYKGTVDDQSVCYQFLNQWHGHGYHDTRLVTELLPYNNSYIWKSDGWRAENCTTKYGGSPDDYEDISHAVQTLNFPLAIYNKLESEGTMLFNTDDMIRYRNTFTFNVFAGYNNGCPQFHEGVDGDDVITYNHSFDGLNSLRIRSLAWMSFYKYDSYSTSPNVYNLVMDYYGCDINNNTSEITNGLDFYGLSCVVAAQ